MLPANLNIITNASTTKQSQRVIMDGIINSGALDTFQLNAIDGLIKSGMPEKKMNDGTVLKPVKGSPSMKKGDIGYVKFPGSRY